jgi:hypothetical protein
MWLQKLRPKALNFMVEPEPSNLGVGLANFKLNNLRGEFIAELVGNNFFGIDKFLAHRTSKWNHLRSERCARFKVLEQLFDGQLTVGR